MVNRTTATATAETGAADERSVEQWLAIRKEAALEINPETAEVMWTYAQTLDPYGVYPDPRREVLASWSRILCALARQ